MKLQTNSCKRHVYLNSGPYQIEIVYKDQEEDSWKYYVMWFQLAKKFLLLKFEIRGKKTDCDGHKVITYHPSSPSVDLDMMIGLKFHLVQREKKHGAYWSGKKYSLWPIKNFILFREKKTDAYWSVKKYSLCTIPIHITNNYTYRSV